MYICVCTAAAAAPPPPPLPAGAAGWAWACGVVGHARAAQGYTIHNTYSYNIQYNRINTLYETFQRAIHNYILYTNSSYAYVQTYVLRIAEALNNV